jgi:putative ABC transport system permease protein
MFQANSLSPGFDLRNTVRADVQLPPSRYKDARKKIVYVEEAVRELHALPGIKAAAAARTIPFTDSARKGSELRFPDTGEKLHALFHWNAVTPEFFIAMNIPLSQGRTFTETDRGGNARVVVVNRTFAERYVSGRRAVGRTFLWGPRGETPYTIVGVVEGTKNMTIGEEPLPQLYEPLAQIANDRTRIQFVVRSATPPAKQVDAVRRTLRRLEPAAGLDVSTLYASIGLAFLPSQVGAALAGSIGILGLTLAAIGLYGVMVYSVTRRTREIGVRMAIGARRVDISRMILADSFRLVAIGSAAGLLIAFVVTRPLARFLMPGLGPSDPVSFVVVIVVLAITALISTWGAVRRGLAIDPMSALRYE